MCVYGGGVPAGAGVHPCLGGVWPRGSSDGKGLEKHGLTEAGILTVASKFQAVVSLIRTEQV